MSRTIVNVATGRYVIGQRRLIDAAAQFGEMVIKWADRIPMGSPRHDGTVNAVPYAFKAYAMQYALAMGHQQIMWADACIVPIKPLDRIWAIAAERGVWICNNGFTNYEWTAESAYQYLYPALNLADAMERNRNVKHVVATAFAVDVRHPAGIGFLATYYALAGTTKAFCGPWVNSKHDTALSITTRCHPCGPADVRGHRHDQTAASVIASTLGIELCDPPDTFAYKGGETDATILVADGAY